MTSRLFGLFAIANNLPLVAEAFGMTESQFKVLAKRVIRGADAEEFREDIESLTGRTETK